MQLMETASASIQRLTHQLQTGPLPKFNTLAEEHRYSFLLICLSHLFGKALFLELGELSVLHHELTALMQEIKPAIKSNHRIVTRYLKILSLDLACEMGMYYQERGELVLSESHLNLAIHLSLKYLLADKNNRMGTLFIIHNQLSQIHLKRGDFLAEEMQYDQAIRCISDNVHLSKTSSHHSKRVWIAHFELARHYQNTGQWSDEQRLLQKTLEVCELFKSRSHIAQFIAKVNLQTTIIANICSDRLSAGQFFFDIPKRFENLLSESDVDGLNIVFKTKEAYLKVFDVACSFNMIDRKKSSVELLILKLKFPKHFKADRFFEKVLLLLFPQKEKVVLEKK